MLLEIRNLNKRFGAVVVADDISLDVEEGEALGIIGPNGAGKSSLFNLVAGNLPPDSGRVVLEGAEVTAMPARQRVRPPQQRVPQQGPGPPRAREQAQQARVPHTRRALRVDCRDG